MAQPELHGNRHDGRAEQRDDGGRGLAQDAVAAQRDPERHPRGRREPARVKRDRRGQKPGFTPRRGAQNGRDGQDQHRPDLYGGRQRRDVRDRKPRRPERQRAEKRPARFIPVDIIGPREEAEGGMHRQPDVDRPPDRERIARGLHRRIGLRNREGIGVEASEARGDERRHHEGQRGGEEKDGLE
ncbi:MAG: hypothetical protein MUE98_14720, partial [Rhodobacteraceae bacterium]|nr:hypothetical protein [Paracoccaceae bacterium]